ncbi:capsule biosynthesis protein CapA [bacterium]|nr:capsule biosynthesis protein CapA [bacterium]
MKNITFLILSALVTSHFLSVPQNREAHSIQADSTSTITISFVGDLMCHTTQMDYSRIGKDSFDFKPIFREVKGFLSSADLTIGNLETTIAGKENKYSGYPLFNSPDEYLDALKDAGFDILLTANNHSIDRGKKGVIRTIEKIQSRGMNSIGTYKSQHDRDSLRIFEINGITIALLAYTYGLNGNYISKNEKYLVNVIDTILIKSDIITARGKNADVVFVYFHFGEEYQRKPNRFQKDVVKCAINSGADFIIGSHPHVIQPADFFPSDKNKIGKGIIAYSLGNFLSNQRWRYSDCGTILTVALSRNITNKQIRLSNVSILPTWVYKGKIEEKEQFVILPIDTLMSSIPNFISKADKRRMLQSFGDTQKMFYKILDQPGNPLNPKAH